MKKAAEYRIRKKERKKYLWYLYKVRNFIIYSIRCGSVVGELKMHYILAEKTFKFILLNVNEMS